MHKMFGISIKKNHPPLAKVPCILTVVILRKSYAEISFEVWIGEKALQFLPTRGEWGKGNINKHRGWASFRQ